MLSESGDEVDRKLYEVIYGYLSMHAHADIMMFIETEFLAGDYHLAEDGARVAFLVAIGLAVMIADIASKVNYEDPLSKRDLAWFVEQQGTAWLGVMNIRVDRRRHGSIIRKIRTALVDMLEIRQPELSSAR